MVSLLVKYDIVKSDIQENTPVLNLTSVSSWKARLCLFYKIDVYKKIQNSQQWILETLDMYLSLSIGQNLPPGLVRLAPVHPPTAPHPQLPKPPDYYEVYDKSNTDVKFLNMVQHSVLETQSFLISNACSKFVGQVLS